MVLIKNHNFREIPGVPWYTPMEPDQRWWEFHPLVRLTIASKLRPCLATFEVNKINDIALKSRNCFIAEQISVLLIVAVRRGSDLF